MRYKLLSNILLSLIIFAASPAWSEDLLIAVAANFAEPMAEIIQQFEIETEHDVSMAVGSSGRFYAQIRNGAPFHIFFSADQDKVARLEAEGLTVSDTRFTYAVGRLLLWAADPESMDIDSIDDLDELEFRRLAIANPRLAPYGAAAMQVLQRLGVADSIAGRLVQGENIAQTFQFVDTRNADLGLVALSQVMRDGKLQSGKGIMVSEDQHDPIKQDVVLLKKGADCVACMQFLAYLQSAEVHDVIAAYGYQASSDRR